MKLDELPLEIFEMVIESVSFVDLPYLLQVSKGIHVPPKSFFSTHVRACLKERLISTYSDLWRNSTI